MPGQRRKRPHSLVQNDRPAKRRQHNPGAICAVELGSKHWALAVWKDGELREVELGQTSDGENGSRPAYRHPIYFHFADDGICLLGLNESPDDLLNTSHGLKQALLAPLYTHLDNEGLKFFQLCEKTAKSKPYQTRYGAELTAERLVNHACTLLFKAAWRHIQELAKDIGDVTRVRLPMPVIALKDCEGREVRDRIVQCAIDAGIPKDRLEEDSEESAAVAYLQATPQPGLDFLAATEKQTVCRRSVAGDPSALAQHC